MSKQKQILIIDELGTPMSEFENRVKKSNLDYEIIWEESKAVNDEVEVIVLVLRKVEKGFLKQFTNLKMIAVAFTGYDTVDMEYCREHNIAFIMYPNIPLIL